jgi:hypothetical protein
MSARQIAYLSSNVLIMICLGLAAPLAGPVHFYSFWFKLLVQGRTSGGNLLP